MKRKAELPKKLTIVGKVKRFSGDRKSAELTDGRTVYRSERLWMGKWGLVRCADTTNHFIFHDPDFNQKTEQWPSYKNGAALEKYIGRWTPICTCGSPAIVTGFGAYKGFASPTTKDDSTHAGMMICCMAMLKDGFHLDGSHD